MTISLLRPLHNLVSLHHQAVPDLKLAAHVFTVCLGLDCGEGSRPDRVARNRPLIRHGEWARKQRACVLQIYVSAWCICPQAEPLPFPDSVFSLPLHSPSCRSGLPSSHTYLTRSAPAPATTRTTRTPVAFFFPRPVPREVLSKISLLLAWRLPTGLLPGGLMRECSLLITIDIYKLNRPKSFS